MVTGQVKNFEAGQIDSKISGVHTKDTEYKGHLHHCTEEDGTAPGLVDS